MTNTPESEYVTATEASLLLGISKSKMAEFFKTGEFTYIADPRNKKAKLVKRSDINAWLAKAPRPKVPHRRIEQLPSAELKRA